MDEGSRGGGTAGAVLRGSSDAPITFLRLLTPLGVLTLLLQTVIVYGAQESTFAPAKPRWTLGERLLLRFGFYDDGYADGYSAGIGARLGRRGNSAVLFSLNKFRGKLLDASVMSFEGNIGAFRGDRRLQNVFRWKANYFLSFQEDSLQLIDPTNGNGESLGDRFLVHLVNNLVGVHRLGSKVHLVYGAGLDLKLSYLIPVLTVPVGMGVQWDVTQQDTIGFFPTFSAEGTFNLVEFDPDEDIYYKWGYLSGAVLARLVYRTRRLESLLIDTLRLSSTSGYLFEQSNANTQDTKFYLHAAGLALRTKPFWRGPLEVRGDYYLKTELDGSIDYRRQEVGVEILKRVRVGAFDISVGPSVSHYDARLEGAGLEEDRYVLNMSAGVRPGHPYIPQTTASVRIGHSDTVITENDINQSRAVRTYAHAAKTAMDALEEMQSNLRHEVILSDPDTGAPRLQSSLRAPLQRYVVQLDNAANALQAGLRLIPENEDTELLRLLLRSSSLGLEQEEAFIEGVLLGDPEALGAFGNRAVELSNLIPDFSKPIDRELLGDLSLNRLLSNLSLNPELAIADFEARLIINALNMIREDLVLGPFQLEKGDIHFLFVTKNIPVTGFKDKAVAFVKSKIGEAFAEEMMRVSDEGLNYLFGQISESIETLPIGEEDRETLRDILRQVEGNVSVEAISQLVGELSYEALLQILDAQAGREVLQTLKDSLNKTLLVFEKDFYELSKHTFVGEDPRKLPGQYLIDDFEAAIDASR